ncbi:class I SAM-dependent methyltransferase [Kitasatospora sp. GAS1066B]|uniref:class I SAM-dependent methyltransferase n=1 Tax=Kitasatospora sp. GAS1066B TaxID=3156271 RepID=UPI003513E911
MNDSSDIEFAKERSWREAKEIDDAFESGQIDQAGWHEAVLAIIEPAYLSASNPRAQSGHSGDSDRWRYARSLLADALPGDGSFLDIGCANGHLMETLTEWGAEAGIVIEPYGVEISAPLAELARARCPQWADRIWTANAANWLPSRRFDIIRTGLDYVPSPLRASYIEHLLNQALVPGGRLVVGVFNEERDQHLLERQVASFGYTVAGRVTREHRHPAIHYKAFWIDS